MADLAGKHIVITGASAGIGAELARMLGARNCRLILAARRPDKLEQVAGEVRNAGGTAHVVRTDVTVRDEVFALADAARAAFGEIDVWINNAGRGMRHYALDATAEDMLELYTLNALSALWGYQAVVPYWKEKGHPGHVIDISSTGGKAGYANNIGYSAAKHALSAIGDTMRQELISTGIKATTVYPGPTVSDFSEASIDRTGGDANARAQNYRESRNWVVRRVAAVQPTEHVARAVIRAIEHPVPTVYPHGWMNAALLIGNLWPGFMLSRLERSLWKSHGK